MSPKTDEPSKDEVPFSYDPGFHDVDIPYPYWEYLWDRAAAWLKFLWNRVYQAKIRRFLRLSRIALAFPIVFVLIFNFSEIARLQAIAILSDLAPSAPYDSVADPHAALGRGHFLSQIRWLSVLLFLAAAYAFCHVTARMTVLLESYGEPVKRRTRFNDLIVWTFCSLLPLLTICRLTLSALGRYGFDVFGPAVLIAGSLLVLIAIEYVHLRAALPSAKNGLVIFLVTVIPLIFMFGTTGGDLLIAGWGSEMALSTAIGPFVCLLVALSCAALGFSLLTHFARYALIPAFTVLALWAFLLSYRDSNDNHPLRLQSERDRRIGTQKAHVDIVDDERLWVSDDVITAAVARWRDDAVANYRRPIVVVSAEGGGIRAAYFTAAALGRIADKCPVIARDMLAVSGVSGGAVGVAAYALAVRTKPISDTDQSCDFSRKGRGYFESRLSRMFRRDLLTPVIARAAFPDLLQAFLPYPVDAFDRQRGLDLALRVSFEREFGTDLFGQAFGQSDARVMLPFVIVGATSVARGQQKLFSELDHPFGRSDRQAVFNSASVIATSARFPIISPPGYIYGDLGERRGNQTVYHKIQYVDGGYYDNSGAYGILQLLSRIQYYRTHSPTFDPKTPILWIRIDNSPQCIADEKTSRYLHDLCEAERHRTQNPSFALRELVSPLRTAVAARSAKEALTILAVRQLLDVNNELEPSRDLEIRIQMAPIEDEIPLGWYLSAAAANSLSWQLSPKQNSTCVLNSSESALADCSLERLQFQMYPQLADPRRVDVNLADWMGGYDGVFEASCRAFAGRQLDPRSALDRCLGASIGDSHFPTPECLVTPLHLSGCEIKASEWSRSRREAFAE